jgi:membrane protease YdiL (CAAX protease family)
MGDSNPEAEQNSVSFIGRVIAHPVVAAYLFFLLWRVLNTQSGSLFGYIFTPEWWDRFDQWEFKPFMVVSCVTAGVSFLTLPRLHKRHVIQGLFVRKDEGKAGSLRHLWLISIACLLFGCVLRAAVLWFERATGASFTGPTPVTEYTWVLGLIVTHGLVALVEEFVWRGVVLSLLLTRFPPLPTLILTGLAFGFWHLMDGQHNLWSVLEIGCAYGLLCGVLFYRTGYLWPAVAFHFGMNLVLYSYNRLMGAMVGMSLYTFLGKLAFFCFLFALLYRYGRGQQKGGERSTLKLR